MTKHLISPDTKLKLIAINKETFKESEKTITYDEYIKLKRNKKFYYKAVQII